LYIRERRSHNSFQKCLVSRLYARTFFHLWLRNGKLLYKYYSRLVLTPVGAKFIRSRSRRTRHQALFGRVTFLGFGFARLIAYSVFVCGSCPTLFLGSWTRAQDNPASRECGSPRGYTTCQLGKQTSQRTCKYCTCKKSVLSIQTRLAFSFVSENENTHRRLGARTTAHLGIRIDMT